MTSSGGALSIAELEKKVKDLHGAVALNPGNTKTTGNYFWALHKFGKELLATSNISRAIGCIKEMMKYQQKNEMGINSSGWLIYRVLEKLQKDSTLHKQYSSEISGLIDNYKRISVPKPSDLHSAMMTMITKLDTEGSDWYVEFFKSGGWNIFQSKDYDPYKADGKLLPSLVEKVMVHLAKQVEKHGNTTDVSWLLSTIDQMITRYPQYEWLQYHKGKLLLKLNKYEEARQYVKPVLISQQKQSWAWGLMGETYIQSDKNMALACFCKSIINGADEKFLVGVREDLGDLLYQLQMFDEAKTEYEQILRTRQVNQWKISNQLQTITTQPWFAQATSLPDNSSLYKKYEPIAESFLVSELPRYIGVVVSVDTARKMAFVCIDRDKRARFKYQKNSKPAVGQLLAVYVKESLIKGQTKYDVVKTGVLNGESHPVWYKEYAGTLRIMNKTDGKAIGFVDDVFIPSNLLPDVSSNGPTQVKGIAIQQLDKKKNQYGWAAITAKAIC